MPKFRNISGKECVKILCNQFGFEIKRQTGSHVILIKWDNGNKIGTVVPNHPDLKRGTLHSVLKLAKIEEEEFAKYI